MRHATITTLGLCVAACGPVPPPSPITYRYAAQVAAPSGAGISGTPLGAGHAAVELQIAHDANNTGSRTRAEGASAHQTVGTHGAARITYGFGEHFEFGPSFEWSFGNWTPAAPDNVVAPTQSWFRGGLNARVHFVRPTRWTFGIEFDLLVSQIPFRTTRGTSTAASSAPSSAPGCDRWFQPTPCSAPAPAPSAPRDPDLVEDDDFARLDLRLGLFGGGRLAQHMWLLGGVTAQTQPAYAGALSSDTLRCGGFIRTCSYEPPTSPGGSAWVGTPWLGVGIDLGVLSLFARIHVNALGPDTITARSPVGFLLASRVNFGR